ncbi:hypothetical protein D9Q98_004670 [Chlorella vulgaris]|uniref:Uncharacterized protein n=1 Tax=Chlorella vulgaris TaxID=3077 RepID=A0A9D4TQE4_CHLVU|nr:hypothetical protein D9Q98_004670 [Chlorella vulgaris]
MPGIASHVVSVSDKNSNRKEREPRASFIAQLEQRQGAGDGGSPDERTQALLACLQRDVNGLSDPDRTTRRRAAEKLHATLLGPSSSVDPTALQAAVSGPLLVPMTRLLADPAEKNRELAASFLAAALPRLPQADMVLSTLVPALAERVGSPPVQEESEEMRLALAELMARPLLARAPCPLPTDLLQLLVTTVFCQLQDGFADIKKAACTSVGKLAALAAPAGLPAALQQPLVQALAANLAHQHSRVRLVSLQALHSLVQLGMPLALMQEHVLPTVRPLAHDHSPAVRAALFSSASLWAGSQMLGGDVDADGRAANQCRAFLPLLLPLLLLGLTDEVEAIRSSTFAQMEAIGSHMTGQTAFGELPMSVTPELPGYCHPFTDGRPSYRARSVVQAHLTRLLQSALAGLREWTATLRAAAARLLRAALIYGEDEVLPQLPTVMLALREAVADEDAGVAMHGVGCVHVIGVNVPARNWMPLATECVAAEQSAAQRTAALVVLAALLHAACKAGTEVDAESIKLASTALDKALQATVAGTGQEEAAVQQLLAACSNLVCWAARSTSLVAPQLFQVLLQLWALQLSAGQSAAGAAGSMSSSAGSLTAFDVLSQLAAALGMGSAAQLCEPYGLTVLQSDIQSHEQWTHLHPGWRTLSALLRLCEGAMLLCFWPLVLPALSSIAGGHDREPHLRLELFQLLVALLEDGSKADSWQQAAMGQQLVSQVLVPGLVWRAGRLPAAMRFTSLSALASLLSQQRLPPEQLSQLAAGGDGQAADGGLLAGVAGCMDDDYDPDTRQLACHVAELLIASAGRGLPAQQVAALQGELLKRLDDSNNHVRVAACAALRPWLLSVLAQGGPTDAGATSLTSTLLIHVDDPDASVAEAACTVLEQLAAARPNAVKPLAEAVAGQHLRHAYMDRVLAACKGEGNAT